MADNPTPQATPWPAEAWQQIAGWLAAADIDCIELGAPGAELRMVRRAGAYCIEELPEPGPGPDAVVAATVGVMAPSAGVLLDRHPARAGGLPRTGDRVRAGELLGLLQIGVVLVPVPASMAGTLVRVLVAPGTLVGYGTRLVDMVEGDP